MVANDRDPIAEEAARHNAVPAETAEEKQARAQADAELDEAVRKLDALVRDPRGDPYAMQRFIDAAIRAQRPVYKR